MGFYTRNFNTLGVFTKLAAEAAKYPYLYGDGKRSTTNRYISDEEWAKAEQDSLKYRQQANKSDTAPKRLKNRISNGTKEVVNKVQRGISRNKLLAALGALGVAGAAAGGGYYYTHRNKNID